jgi:hypothetical protein
MSPLTLQVSSSSSNHLIYHQPVNTAAHLYLYLRFLDDKNSYKVIFDVEEGRSVGGGIQTSVGNNEGSLVR